MAQLEFSQSALSTQMIQLQVVVAGGYDPSDDPVEFAFVLDSYPMGKPEVWYSGSWIVFAGPGYWAQCLVGPDGGANLKLGTYQVWLRIHDDPEVPVLQSAFLTITQ